MPWKTIKNGIIGESHVGRIKKTSSIIQLETTSGANTERFAYFILPTLHEDKPDVTVLHIAPNDITSKDTTADIVIVDRIVSIVKICKNYGVREVTVSCLFFKSNFKLHEIIIMHRN